MAFTTQIATRINVNEFDIFDSSGRLQTAISLQKRVFTSDGAPLASALRSSGLADAPTLSVNGVTCLLCKKLLTEKFFANRFDIGLQDLAAFPNEKDTNAELCITARSRSPGITTLIQ